MGHYDDILRDTLNNSLDSNSPVHPRLVALAVQLLIVEESYKQRPYLCSEGYPTVGYGQRIGPKDANLGQYQFSLPKTVAHKWLAFNVALLVGQLATHPKIEAAFANCDLARQTVLVSMAYQLGVKGLAKFKNTLAAIQDGRWDDAKAQALDSRWAKQTPERACRHAETLATGVLI